jgi:hypothetical protein
MVAEAQGMRRKQDTEQELETTVYTFRGVKIVPKKIEEPDNLIFRR